MNLPFLNRCAFVLLPKKAYFDWAKEYPDPDPELTMDDLRDEATVYLIPEIDGDPDVWLEQNYLPLFEEELAAWCTAPELWPANRSYKAFRRFLEVRYCSLVMDTSKNRLVREGC